MKLMNPIALGLAVVPLLAGRSLVTASDQRHLSAPDHLWEHAESDAYEVSYAGVTAVFKEILRVTGNNQDNSITVSRDAQARF
jgi:hypothetical protein